MKHPKAFDGGTTSETIYFYQKGMASCVFSKVLEIRISKAYLDNTNKSHGKVAWEGLWHDPHRHHPKVCLINAPCLFNPIKLAIRINCHIKVYVDIADMF